jgi:putative transposase
MADENNMGPTTDAAVADAPVKVVEPKKQRAPRRPKAATDMMGGLTVAKLPRGRRKRSEQATEATLTSAETPVASKRKAKGVVKEDGRKTRQRKPVEQPVAAPVVAIDEMADLIQLEEENKRLRKALSEKLRAENADLRKRLGLD